MITLDDLRNEIDIIDRELTSLFTKRMNASKKVAEVKTSQGLPVLNVAREQAVIDRVASLAEEELKTSTQYLFEYIMALSRQYQQQMMDCKFQIPQYQGDSLDYPVQVTYQGVEGSYSEEATLAYFNGDVKRIHVDTFKEVLDNIENGISKYGILPIENSNTGSINDVYALLQKYDCYIIGEYKLSISHCLVGIEGSAIDDIKEVYSHEQGLLQCSGFLGKYPKLKKFPYYNTAMSAKMVYDSGDTTKAAIASKRSAQKYGLCVLAENISNADENYTNFIIVSKQFENSLDNDKISVALSLRHEVGALYKLLTLFYINNINLLKLESRPLFDKPFEYYFFVDFEGNINDKKIQTLINSIMEHAQSFKLLGNYKKIQ